MVEQEERHLFEVSQDPEQGRKLKVRADGAKNIIAERDSE